MTTAPASASIDEDGRILFVCCQVQQRHAADFRKPRKTCAIGPSASPLQRHVACSMLATMSHRRAYRAACAALVVPLILLVGFRSAWALYTCRVDGVVRSACCCNGTHRHVRERAPSRDPRLESSSCCAISVQTAPKAPDLQTPARADDHPAPATLAIVQAQLPSQPTVTVPRADRAHERPPPIATFLIKQSFLR